MSLPRDFELVLVAATPRTIEYRGYFLGVIDAPSAALDVEIDGSSPPLRVGPGGSILSSAPFSRVRLTSSVNQTVRIRIADQVQDVSNIVAAGGGASVTVEEAPSLTISTPADNAIAAATTEAIAANATRRRITIGVLSTAAVGVRVRAAAAPVLSGIEIQPGFYEEFKTEAALEVRNDDATLASSYYIFEET